MKKLICKLFAHNWKYIPKPDILSNKRICIRCGRLEKRIEFVQKQKFILGEKWIGVD